MVAPSAPRVWARQTGLLEPKDACGRVVAHSEVTSQIAQSGDYSREVAICLGIGAKCVNSSAFSGTYFSSTVASTEESTVTKIPVLSRLLYLHVVS